MTSLPRTSALTGLLCLLLISCSASIKPALKKSVDAQISELSTSQDRVEAVDSPVGYQPGQWLRYRIVNEKGEPTIATHKFLDSDGDTHVIESVTESYYSKQTVYMEIRYAIGAPLSSLELLRVISSSDVQSTPQEASGFEMSIMGSTYEALAKQLFHQETPAEGDADVSVVAGTFVRTYEKDTELRWGPFSCQAHSWHHSAVPMHGMVKAERSDGTPGTTELIAYGHVGARSEVLAVLR
jgi:hypothetical protein